MRKKKMFIAATFISTTLGLLCYCFSVGMDWTTLGFAGIDWGAARRFGLTAIIMFMVISYGFLITYLYLESGDEE